MRLIYLEWCDAISNTIGWHTKEDLENGGWDSDDVWIVKQVGWVYKETSKYILLISQVKPGDIFTEEQYAHIEKIPKTWIIKRQIINIK